MSQRECAGFNWPPLSIAAQEPISISPEAVKRAGVSRSHNGAACPSVSPNPFPLPVRSLHSARRASNRSKSFAPNPLELGVGQPASAAVFLLLSLFPAALFPFCAGVPAIGVGQPATPTNIESSIDFPIRTRR